MAAIIICSDFGAPQNKVWHCFHSFPIYFPMLYWYSFKLVNLICELELCMHAKLLQLYPTLCDLWTVDLQAPLFMVFSRQEYCSGLPCSPSGDLPNLGIKPKSFTSPAVAGGFFTTRVTREALCKSPQKEKSQMSFLALCTWKYMSWRSYSEGNVSIKYAKYDTNQALHS